jgi:Ca-activated chloride channel family protein
LRFKPPTSEQSQLLTHTIAHELAEPSIDFMFASAVASFGMILRESEHRGSATIEQVIALATDGMGQDEGGYRSAFVRAVEQFSALTTNVASSN